MRTLKFPVTIRRGSVTTRVYRVKRGDGRETFSAVWYLGGIRQIRQFSDFNSAFAEATFKAEQLTSGRIEAASLTISERDEYLAAKHAANGTPLMTIVQEWQRARKLAGPDIVKACEAWSAKHNGTAVKAATVNDAVTRFLASKRADGVDTEAGYARTLPKFVEKFGPQPIASLSPNALSAWLTAFKHPGSINSHRKRIVALFRWCRKRGLLPLDTMTAAERTDSVREGPLEIGLVTPDELARTFALIQEKAPHYIPALAVASLCGLRRVEVHGQDWKDIDLERRFLRVSAAKANTASRRLVPLCDAVIAWLSPLKQASGPICANLSVDRIRDIARTAGLDLANNGFRHSFISARVVVTGNVHETAMEAGNSPKVLHRHYRELLRPDEAAAWFSVSPSAVNTEKMQENAA